MIKKRLKELDNDIRITFLTANVDLELGFTLLRELWELNVTPLMIKINSRCVHTLQLLSNCFGNSEEMEYSEVEQLQFNEQYSIIRQFATEIFHLYLVSLLRVAGRKIMLIFALFLELL